MGRGRQPHTQEFPARSALKPSLAETPADPVRARSPLRAPLSPTIRSHLACVSTDVRSRRPQLPRPKPPARPCRGEERPAQRHPAPHRERSHPTSRRPLAPLAFAGLTALLALTLPFAAACQRRGPASTAPGGPSAEVDPDAPPIAWSEWERGTFAKAAEERRLVLVTVVADWCHWCHVMDEETYTDLAIRTLLDRYFVAIRVEADARPDLAERYAEWGWPAIAVLTPDARPVLELRGYQRAPGFADLLRELVRAEAEGTLTGRRDPPAKAPPSLPLRAIRDRVMAQLDRTYDPQEQGWGRRQKYPLAGGIEHALLRSRLRPEAATDTSDKKENRKKKKKEKNAWQERALATLEQELLLVDPVWGGMYQYSVGGVWTRPHFEKIGKVQVGALSSFALAYRRTGDPRWLAAGDTQLGYLQDHLLSPEGGFYSSQDADLRQGEEVVPGDVYYAEDDAGRRALGIPRIDRHIYADLNGGFIRSLCTFDAVDPRPAGERSPALALALAAGEHLLRTHLRDDGTFHHDPGADDPLIYLRDQAAVGRALLSLYQATGEQRWLGHARTLADRILAELVDPERGSFFAHTEDPEAVGVFTERRQPIEENGEAARFLIELQRLLDHKEKELPYIDAAEAALLALADPEAIKREGRVVTSYLLALEELLFTPVDVTVVADDPDARRQLIAAARAADEPRATIEASPPGERYPAIGRDAAYICSDSACSPPISDPKVLGERLLDFTAPLDTDR